MKKLLSTLIVSLFVFSGCEYSNQLQTLNSQQDTPEYTQLATFAGGCFWCMQPAFDETTGVVKTTVGYAGGDSANATYKKVSAGETQHREVIQVEYDPQAVSYEKLVQVFLEQIDPTDSGGQFADRGFQYTTALYYHSLHQKREAEELFTFVQENKEFDTSFAIEIEEYTAFYAAEKYHQSYYKKDPNHYYAYKKGSGREGYIQKTWANSDALWEIKKNNDMKKYENKISSLSPLQKNVIFEEGTEQPFNNEFWDNKREGIYTDKISGDVLFSSQEKFVSGTGWPSFVSPLHRENIEEKIDTLLATPRREIRGRNANTHLGHVFADGPKDKGGMRYCMNSASLDFIPLEELEERGYSDYTSLFN